MAKPKDHYKTAEAMVGDFEGPRAAQIHATLALAAAIQRLADQTAPVEVEPPEHPTLTQLDALPDPGRVITPLEDATCALCGEPIKAGDDKGLWIRTKAGGGKQYLHTRHQTDN